MDLFCGIDFGFCVDERFLGIGYINLGCEDGIFVYIDCYCKNLFLNIV